MPGFFPNLMRLMNPGIFNPPVGNDLPEQGGITGQLPMPDSFQQNIADPVTNPITQPLQPGFEQQTPVTPMFGGGEQVEPDSDFIRRRMTELYTPEHSASDRFNSLVESYPERGKPNFLNRIGSIMVGAANDPVRTEHALNPSFYRNLEDWKNQIQPVSQAATLERYMNANERTFANNEVQREIQDRDERRKEARDKTYEKDVESKRAARQANVDFKYWKQQHPDYKLEADGDGYVYGINPQTMEVEYALDSNGDYVKRDKLPEMERIRIQQKNAMERIGAQGANAANVARIRGEESRKTNSAKPTASGKAANELGPKDLRQVWQNRATEIINEDPDAENYIDTSGGEIRVTTPSHWMSDPTPAEIAKAKKIRDRIFSPTGPTKGEPSTKNSVSMSDVMGNELPPPEKRVIGKTYTLKNGKKGIWRGTGFELVEGQ